MGGRRRNEYGNAEWIMAGRVLRLAMEGNLRWGFIWAKEPGVSAGELGRLEWSGFSGYYSLDEEKLMKKLPIYLERESLIKCGFLSRVAHLLKFWD